MKETSGTLSNNTVAIPADPGRDALVISNNSDTVMTYRPGATATAAIGISVPAGDSTVIPKPFHRAGGTLFCAGASKAYTLYEA